MPLFAKLSKKQPNAISIEQRSPKENDLQLSSTNGSNELTASTKEITVSVEEKNESRIEKPFSNGHLSPNDGGFCKLQDSSPRTSFRSPTPPPPPDSVKTIKGGNPMSLAPPPPQDTKLVFHCQLAHGSPTGLLYGFTNLRELYERAAECYEIPMDDILYCTLNTHKVDMEHLLGGQIGLEDFIFIHLKGQKKEVEVVKDESSLGVTITDNGSGKAFIKRIKPDSVIGRLGDVVRPGDHIECVNGDSMVGKKHYDVAKQLRDLPLGVTMTLRLIEPLKVGTALASPRSSVLSSSSFSKSTFLPANVSGMQTLRFKAKGTKAPVVVAVAPRSVVIDRINAILESYLGIHDSELALTIWDMAKEPSNASNPVTFLASLRQSDLAEFQIPDEVVFDLWAATRDGKYSTPRTTAVSFDIDGEKTLTRPSS